MNNLLSLQQKLEQAPDEWLAQEITKPSGRIPVPLIYSEMQRRKDMRQSALAKSKGDIMGLYRGGPADGFDDRGIGGMMGNYRGGGIYDLQTLPSMPQFELSTLPSMPEEETVEDRLRKVYGNIVDWFTGLTETENDEVKPTPKRKPKYKPAPRAIGRLEPYEEESQESNAPFDPSWVGKTSPEAAEETRRLHAELNKGFPGHDGKMPVEEEESGFTQASSSGIGALPQSEGSNSFFKALEDEMGQFGANQQKYMDEMGKNRDAYLEALKNDPYAELIKQQQAKVGEEQKWGIPLMALASGILGGRNLAQGLSQGVGNMIPALEAQRQEKLQNERRLQDLMLGQGQMKRGDAKDVFGINSDMAKSGYGMYGDKLNMLGKMAELGLAKERNDINRAEVAARAAYLQSGGSRNPMSGYVGILKIDTSSMEPEQAEKINKLKALILDNVFGVEDEESVMDPSHFGVGIDE